MLLFNRTRSHKRVFISAGIILCSLLSVYNNYAQVGITGPTSVNQNTSYTYYPSYNGSNSYSYSGWYTWTISGGYETSTGNTSKSGTCYSVLYSIGINVTWTSSSGSLTFNSSLGSKTINITAIPPLNAGTISPTSQTINYGATATTLTGTAASGGAASPSYSYQWQSSPDAVNWTDISGATGLNYSPGTLYATIYYRRKVTETTTSSVAYTSTATVTVYPQLTCSISPSSQSINYNTTSSTLTSSVSGGSGSYSYQWQSSTDNSNWSNVATTSTYSPGALTTTTYYRLVATSNSANVTSNTATVTVYPQLTCSISPSSQNINYNTTPSGLSSSVNGGNGSYSYQWQSSPDNSIWTNISTSSSYSPGALTATTYYRLTVISNSVSVTSNTATITVYPQLTCSISPSSQTISPGTSPSTLNSSVSGGNGTYSYQWQSSTDNISWTNAATTSTYNPGNLSVNQFYRLTVTSNGVSVTSNTATVNVTFSVSLSITSTTPSGNGSINAMSCTASGGSGGYSYAWYYSTNGGSSYQQVSGATSSTYTTGVITTTTLYYVTVTSGGSSANSNTVSITMPTAPTISANATTLCNGASTTLTANGGSGSYKWYNSGGTQLGTGSTYSTSTAGSYYAASYNSFGISGPSNTITIITLNTPSVSSIIGSSVCVIGSSAQLANSVTGGTWSSNNNSIAKVDANGVVTGVAAGTATITYTVTNACGTSSAQLGITVVPFTDLSQSLGKGIDDYPKYDTIALVAGTMKTLSFAQDTLYSSAHTIKNVLALRVIEETNKYIPGDFAATAVLKVEYGHSSADVYLIDSIKLTVSYTKNAGNKYNASNYFTFNNAEFTRITVLRVEAPTTVNGTSFDTKQVLQLTNTLAGTRYYKLADNKKSVLSYTNPSAGTVPDALQVSWVLPDHSQNNGVQLEWAWLENEMSNSYVINNVFDTALLFKTSSTRIDLPGGAVAGGYNIPLLYDGVGKLYMRVRGVNIMPSGSRSDGPWSGVQTFAFNGHSDSLNWQVTTTYAEEGKRKTVIQYYDGSLRPRQTVTKDNTTGQTVVAETLYDMQGRPAVQILPAPGINNIIAHTKNLNKFNTQADNSNPADYFDFTTSSLGNYATTPLSENSGTAKYYSTQNPDASTGYHKNIPAANGWAYTVTRYTPDATGRIMRQSGAGDSLKMGSGHETKYFYGTPAQEELDALFGTEVGNYTHYFKNMVQDANGQMSVSYVDMHGRTIATALAGNGPAAVQALAITDTTQYKNQAGKILTRNLLDKGSNILKENSIESINSILVPFPTLHSFSYQLTKQTLTLPKCTGGTVSYDCKFNLQVSVTDESGDTNPVVYNYTGIDNINFNQSLLLNAGSYSVRKTLTINPDSLDKFIALYNTDGVGLCKTQQQLIDSIYAQDSTGCGVTTAALTSSSCMASLGDRNTYLSNYATTLGKTTAQLTTAQVNDIINQYIADSSFCASLNQNTSSALQTIRRQILADMVPYSGQYARDTGTVSMAKKYNIFATGGSTPYTQPFYKYPRNQALAVDNYYNAFGNIDSSVLASRLQTMTMTDFEQEFKDSWTKSLLPYHPEFKKLKFAEDSLRSSFNFIDSIQLVSAAFTPISSDPFFAIASRAADKDTITQYSNVAWTGMGGYSMWQIAYGDAFGCKTKVDTAQRNGCYNAMPKVLTATGTAVNTGSGSVTLSAAIQSQAWMMYKAMYSQVRGDMVNGYINVRPGTTDTADNRTLVNQGFRIYFPYNYVQAAQNNGWTAWYPGAGASTNVNLEDSVALYSNHCDSYINAWRTALLDCPALAAKDSATREQILNSITAKMQTVCKNGTDGVNPYGSSTVAPAYSNATYTSFEQAVNYVLDSAGIAKNLYCHPYGIEWPKPYGKNQPVTKQYVTALDTCTCNQWNKLKTEVSNAGYNNTSLTSINQYLQGKYQDTISTTLYNGLQQCSSNYLYNCRQVNTTCYDHGVPFACTITVCDTLYSLPLASPQSLPPFLNCGFDSSSYKCYSCSDFTSLDNSFYTIFGKHPVFTGAITNDTTIAWNELFAKYVNFKTGLQHTWQYYAEKFNTAGCPIGGIPVDDGIVSICLERKPLNDTTGFTNTLSLCQIVRNRATEKGTLLYEYNSQKLMADFKAAYLSKCLASAEVFTVADTLKEYHYTLYYYDQDGNLVKTVPPKGVNPNYNSVFLTAVKTERDKMIAGQSWIPQVPQHSLVTRYCYNSLNQVVIQKSPDGGVSKFYYDKLGRLAISQNAKQTGLGNVYSYTKYDSLGRITEVGQITGGSAMTDATAKNESSLQSWFSNANNTRNQITQTIYDIEYGPINGIALSQKNLRNRVSYSQVINNATDTYPASATYYTYDIHGNVDTLLQDFGNSTGIANAMNQSGNRFKKIVYNYDLISGKVNQVSYQPGAADAYYQRYVYDGENRLTDVYSGRDSVMLLLFPEREAHYNYYKHGTLARTELGQLRVQGMDYAYTLQGWIKAVNPAMGGTLTNGTDTTEAYPAAVDAYAFSLHYYKGDYKAIGYTPQATSVLGALGTNAAPLYNGNIAAMAVNIPKLGATKLYNYHYDQLNRIVAMDVFNGLSPASGTFTPVNISDYRERISYDPNGNILTYNRHGDAVRLSMDSLSYFYKANTNQLHKVTDAAADAAPADYSRYNDIKQGQADNNYQYDGIGNLVSDASEGITNITWSVYGKILSITKSGAVIRYVYDASGNRIMKYTATDTTVYVRDASGNVMSVYSKPAGGTLSQTEMHLYGSSRLGMATKHLAPDTSIALLGGFGSITGRIFTRGEKLFELGDHLQNVLVTISDKKIGVDGNTDGMIDYYEADVITANDYYPGGMLLPGRTFNSSSYRYGFQNQEIDKELWGGAVAFEYRIEDPRLVRFFSADPLEADYPHNSPYAFAENRLIDGIELEGLEWMPTKDKKENITGYNWVGYNADGTPVKGSESGGIVDKTYSTIGGRHGSSTYIYSSNAKDRSGTLSVINFDKPSQAGRSSEVYDATYDYDYTVRFKHVSGGKSGYGYDVTAQLSRFGESSQEFKFDGFRGGTNSGAYKDDDAIRNAGRSAGLAGQSPALIHVYPETILLPLPKGLNLLGKSFKAATGGTKQWLRLGRSYSIEGGFKTYGLRWGASPRYASKIGNVTLRQLNQDFRKWKIPFKSWRTADPGHLHFWKLK